VDRHSGWAVAAELIASRAESSTQSYLKPIARKAGRDALPARSRRFRSWEDRQAVNVPSNTDQNTNGGAQERDHESEMFAYFLELLVCHFDSAPWNDGGESSIAGSYGV
jgi:hypothetical protein